MRCSRLRSFAVLFLCLLLGACGKREATGPGVPEPPELERWIPADVVVAGGIDMERLRKSPLYQRHSALLNGLTFTGIPGEAGLDIRQLSSVVVFEEANNIGVLLSGGFSTKDLTRRLIAHGGQTATYRGKTLVTLRGRTGWDCFFPSRDVAATGPAPVLHRLIDGPGGLPDGMRNRLNTLPAADQIWLSANSLQFVDQLTTRTDVRSITDSLNQFLNGTAVGIALDTGLHAQAQLSCYSPSDAQQVRAAVRAGIAFARLSTREALMLQIYKTIDVEVNGTVVQVRMELPPALTEELISLL